VRAHRVVGDFDSVTPDALSAAEAAGARIDRYPTAKDATDLELALEAARAEASRIIVVGGDGGRLDHLLSIALLLGSSAYADRVVVAYLGPATVHVVRSTTRLTGVPGELVSLLALHGPAHGVRTSGLQYPLHDETLHPGSSRGVSNQFTGEVAQVAIAAGVLLAVQPSHLR
jgi:thiamine pyrophosphokinase